MRIALFERMRRQRQDELRSLQKELDAASLKLEQQQQKILQGINERNRLYLELSKLRA